ncbi:MAG TPA: HD domain-containing protein [Gemmatimonadales bacterium]|nr:HD domain-containing protein [Gemmatimonadales bacterium]
MSLPSWAVVSDGRKAHIERVAELIASWADAMDVGEREKARWLRAAYLHDALRNAKPESGMQHGPKAAERAEQEGERDRGVLDAVRYHTIGYPGWDDVGRMLYLADFLEPGRAFKRWKRRSWANRVPRERDVVLREVAAMRLRRVIKSGWPLPKESVEFWNSLAAR